jgi:5-methylcytosine-specific restriction endonuclease McrA
MSWSRIYRLKPFVRLERVKNKAKRKMRKARKAGESEFFLSGEWRIVRYKALKRSKGCCDCCGARGSAKTPLHVDHIKPRSRFPDLALELNNLQVLCEACNLGKLNWDTTDWRSI